MRFLSLQIILPLINAVTLRDADPSARGTGISAHKADVLLDLDVDVLLLVHQLFLRKNR